MQNPKICHKCYGKSLPKHFTKIYVDEIPKFVLIGRLKCKETVGTPMKNYKSRNAKSSLFYNLLSDSETLVHSQRLANFENDVGKMRIELQTIQNTKIPNQPRDLNKFSKLAKRLSELEMVLSDLKTNYNIIREQEQLKEMLRKNKKTKVKLNSIEVESRTETESTVASADETISSNEFPNHKSLQDFFENYSEEPAKISNLMQRSNSPRRDANIEDTETKVEVINTPLKQTKNDNNNQDGIEVKTPFQILEKDILNLKDFRTDPELRLERLKKKELEKIARKQQEDDKLKEDTNNFPGAAAIADAIEQPFDDKQVDYTEVAVEENPLIQNVSTNEVLHFDNHNYILDIMGSLHKRNTFELESQPLPANLNETKADSDRSQSFSGRKENIPVQISPNKYDEFTIKDDHNENNLLTPEESSDYDNIPMVTKNLRMHVLKIILAAEDIINVALSVELEEENLYYVNISEIHNGLSVGSLYATYSAVEEAQRDNLFVDFLTLFILNPKLNSNLRHSLVDHSFQVLDRNQTYAE